MVAQECAGEREHGALWTHPTNRRKSWDRHWTQFVEAMESAKNAPDCKSIGKLGELVMAMVLGMIGVILAIGLAVDRALFVPVERWVARRWGTEGA